MSSSLSASLAAYAPTSPLQFALTVLAVSIGYGVAGLSGAAVGALVIPIGGISITMLVAGLVLFVVTSTITEEIRDE